MIITLNVYCGRRTHNYSHQLHLTWYEIIVFSFVFILFFMLFSIIYSSLNNSEVIIFNFIILQDYS
jgi:ABC-type siderophore export system fused ATPase/permease subunit